MAPKSYADVMAQNIVAARSRARLGQADVAARMRELGYGNWYAQTVGKTENGERRLLAHEIAGLAIALETTIARLMAPLDEDGEVSLYDSGPSIPVLLLQLSAIGKITGPSVQWEGNKLLDPAHVWNPAIVDVIHRMAAGTWPPSGEEN